MNLPVDFTNRMKEYLQDEYEAFLASYKKPEVKGIRFNTLAPGEYLGAICNNIISSNRETKKVPWCDEGYYYINGTGNTSDGTEFRPGKHPYHEAGAYYIQEPSAMAPVTYLEVEPGDRVLDLCASPGGKSTQIAAKLQGEGILIANEIMPDRAKILSENIERMGVRNALVISEDPRNISDKFAGFFDKVLVDAPCSGEGMFRRGETAVNEWSLENVAACASRQEWILDEAAKMLEEGGTLCYSTCTFSREENEEQIASFLKRHEEFELSEMTVYEGMSRGYAADGYDSVGIRLFPHKLDGEGHYVCRLRKKGVTEIKVPPVYGYEPDLSKKDRADLKDMFSLFEDIFTGKLLEYIGGRRITRFKDQIYLLPKDCPSLKGLRVLRPGLHLGTVLKNRFEPGHALAMAVSADEVKKKCILTSEGQEIYKYFNGETFNVTDEGTGWHVIFVDGISAGWGKLTNLVMKNHFPKGIRKNLR